MHLATVVIILVFGHCANLRCLATAWPILVFLVTADFLASDFYHGYANLAINHGIDLF